MNQQKKIIIIDDDERNIFALNAVLKAKGYNCVTASSARQGLSLLQEQHDIQLALVDMMMPDMDGYEMITEMRKKPSLKTLPVIAVTAQAMLGDKEKCIETGADNYISKPINVDALVKILGEYI